MKDTEDKRRHKGIFLLPNLFTTGALFAGFYAIIAATGDRFGHAAIAIFIAMLLDTFDGRIARMTQTDSKFGAHYDSISDMVSFGIAPSLTVYEWTLTYFETLPWMWSKLCWLVAFFYTAAAALRLSRFNARVTIVSKRYFQGLPSPAASGTLVGFIWVCHDAQLSRADFAVPALVIAILLGACMVSNFSYYSFKDINLHNRAPFVAMLAIVLGFILASIDTPKLFFALCAIYALSGPATYFMRLPRKHRLRASSNEKRRV